MTIICREYKLLFLENRNTASTAIRAALREHLGGEQLLTEPVKDASGKIIVPWRHATLHQLMGAGVISPAERAGLTVVSGSRNPFDLAVTEYARLRPKLEKQRAEKKGLPPPVATELTPADFERFVRRRYSPSLRHRLLGRKGKVPDDFPLGADRVIRFERLQEDFDEVLRSVGVTESIEIPKRNVTRARGGRDYREFYTPAARRIVASAYAGQLKRYGYRFEGATQKV